MATYTHDSSLNSLASAEDIKQLKDYLFQNNELLRYMFGNLDPEENYSASALKKYIERDDRISTLEFTANGLKVSIKDLEKETEAHFKVLDDEIALKVDIGDVSNQLSVETEGITISGKRLKISTTNLTLTTDGTLICKNGQFSGTVKSTTISSSSISGGTIDVGILYADDEEGYLGDFCVSTGETYRFYSSDGSFYVETAEAPGGSAACMVIGNGKGTNQTEIWGGNIEATGIIRADAFYDTGVSISHMYDVRLGKSWWNDWTISQTVHKLWNMVFRLARIVDNQWDDWSGVEDELDEWDSDHNDPTDW